jgi:hypothetical protein
MKFSFFFFFFFFFCRDGFVDAIHTGSERSMPMSRLVTREICLVM